jgi:hypothetical protein
MDASGRLSEGEQRLFAGIETNFGLTAQTPAHEVEDTTDAIPINYEHVIKVLQTVVTMNERN